MLGFEAFSPAALAWIVAVLAFAGLVHGALGMGFPTIATSGGVAATQWLTTLPLAGLSLITLSVGIRVRSRVDADTIAAG